MNTSPTLNDLAIAADLGSLAHARSPTPAAKVAMLDAQRAHDNAILAIDARQREAIARAQAVAA